MLFPFGQISLGKFWAILSLQPWVKWYHDCTLPRVVVLLVVWSCQWIKKNWWIFYHTGNTLTMYLQWILKKNFNCDLGILLTISLCSNKWALTSLKTKVTYILFAYSHTQTHTHTHTHIYIYIYVYIYIIYIYMCVCVCVCVCVWEREREREREEREREKWN